MLEVKLVSWILFTYNTFITTWAAIQNGVWKEKLWGEQNDVSPHILWHPWPYFSKSFYHIGVETSKKVRKQGEEK